MLDVVSNQQSTLPTYYYYCDLGYSVKQFNKTNVQVMATWDDDHCFNSKHRCNHFPRTSYYLPIITGYDQTRLQTGRQQLHFYLIMMDGGALGLQPIKTFPKCGMNDSTTDLNYIVWRYVSMYSIMQWMSLFSPKLLDTPRGTVPPEELSCGSLHSASSGNHDHTSIMIWQKYMTYSYTTLMNVYPLQCYSVLYHYWESLCLTIDNAEEILIYIHSCHIILIHPAF